MRAKGFIEVKMKIATYILIMSLAWRHISVRTALKPLAETIFRYLLSWEKMTV